MVVFQRSASVDPASIAAESAGNTDVTVAGVKAGDLVIAHAPIDLEVGLVPQAVSAPADNTVRVRLKNATAGAVDGAAKTWAFTIIRAADESNFGGGIPWAG